MEIEVSGISKTYEGKVPALVDVSFSLKENGIFSLIGENGAGKTTMVRILSTQLLPTSGSAIIDGIDVVTHPREIRERIAAVPQEARAVPWMTPIQTITSYLMYRGYTHADAMQMASDTIRKLGMEEFEHQKNRKLSGGQKRKVLVATVLASEADIIFMDEPSTGLDYISRRDLWNLFSSIKESKSIILTTHYLEEAEELASRIGILNKGHLVGFGTMDELRRLSKYPYSIRVSSPDFDLEGDSWKIVHLGEAGTQIFTYEDQVYNLVSILISRGLRFTVQEISLNTIFENVVYGGTVND
jgi:ABC-2 type transport system ATP-binding protein